MTGSKTASTTPVTEGQVLDRPVSTTEKPSVQPPTSDWRTTADELIEEVRRSEILTREDLAIRINARD